MTQTFYLDLKIKDEKRRRNQIYILLDYISSSVTYFDFFSNDAFKISKKSKYLSFHFNQDVVTSEILLLSFFNPQDNINLFLQENDINEDKILIFIKNYLNLSSSFSFFLFNNFNNKINFIKNQDVREIEFSDEVNLIFLQASDNAIKRFKTPIISSYILFLTLMEQKRSKAYKILKKLIPDEIEWNLLRYKLIKKIHIHESNLQTEILANQQYFGYLLKTQLKDIYFERLIENNILEIGISLFRNILIYSIIKQNIFDQITNEISNSITITNRRQYFS
jgi:hypothetical protein